MEVVSDDVEFDVLSDDELDEVVNVNEVVAVDEIEFELEGTSLVNEVREVPPGFFSDAKT